MLEHLARLAKLLLCKEFHHEASAYPILEGKRQPVVARRSPERRFGLNAEHVAATEGMALPLVLAASSSPCVCSGNAAARRARRQDRQPARRQRCGCSSPSP